MEQIGLYLKKYVFPVGILIFGLWLLKMGLFVQNGTEISQSTELIIGSTIICAVAILIFLYVSEIISKKINIIILSILLIGCVFLGYKTYKSVNDTITQIENKKDITSKIKQRLRDIELIQIEYKKKYGWYSNNFAALKSFLENDSIFTISTYGTVPDTRITPEHAELLGYDPIENYKELEEYTDEEALKCGLLRKDTVWVNVKEKLFSDEEGSENRTLVFNADSISFVPTLSSNNSKKFYLKADFLENPEGDKFNFVLVKNSSPNHFVSSNLIDHNGEFEKFYKKNRLDSNLNPIEGLIVKDSVPPFKSLIDRDVIISANELKINTADSLFNIISNLGMKDTISLQVNRNEDIITMNIPIAEILTKKSSSTLSDLYDQLYYNLSPPLYNPKEFHKMNIPPKMVNKEDEFSPSLLVLDEFLNFFSAKNGDTSEIYLEFEMGDNINLKSPEKQNAYFHTFSITGSSVFMAMDPNPYDPLLEKDTLKTGSLSEVKTSGNWK